MNPEPRPAPLIDRFGRTITYLRLSVTDRCDLRCTYCMAEKMDFLPRADLLSLEELERLCLAFIARGVRKIRITGGEPLAQMQSLQQLCTLLRNHSAQYRFEVETNATLIPDAALDAYIDLYVCSPKLANALVPAGLRLNDAALRWYAGCERACFKFVVSSAADLDEIRALQAQYGLAADRIYLMPQALSADCLRAAQEEVTALCLQHGYRYSDRMHLHLFGAGRGV